MRKLHREEQAAIWLYHKEYAAQCEGAIEFYRLLTKPQKMVVDKMISDIVSATPLPKGKKVMTQTKTRTVLVKCLVVSSDRVPVNQHGEEFGKGYPVYEWDKRRRSAKWLRDPKNKRQWKEITR